MSHALELPKQQSVRWQIKQYSPIILASLLIIGLTTLVSLQKAASHMLMPMQTMALFMGFYFIVYALPKFINLKAYVTTVRRYDYVAKRFPIYGYSYPFIELAIGGLYISGLTAGSVAYTGLLNIVVVALSTLNIMGIYDALKQKKNMSCGCLGTAMEVPLSKVTLFENILMLAMAAVMIVLFKPMVM